MKCNTARRELESFRNRDSSESLRGQIKEHLKSCGSCREYFKEWENLAGLHLEREVPAIPEDLTQRILEAIPQTHLAQGKRDSRYKPRISFFWKALPIAVAAEIAILLLLNFLILRPASISIREYESPVVAEVVDVQGDVSISTVEGWEKLGKGDSVRAFTTVRTASSASARIKLTDGSVVELSAETSMTLLGVTGEARARMTFDKGKAHFYVADTKGKFLVDVPPVGRRIMVLGTEFKLRLEKERGNADMEITHKIEKFVACTLVVTVLSGEVLAETIMGGDQGLRIAAGETERLSSALPGDTDKAERERRKRDALRKILAEKVAKRVTVNKALDEKKAIEDSERTLKRLKETIKVLQENMAEMRKDYLALSGKKENIKEIVDKRKVSLFCTETPLSQVLRSLTDLTGIDFVLDLKKGVDPLITIRVNTMTLRKVLDWLATLSGTKWGLENEAGLKNKAIYFEKDIEGVEPVPAKKGHDTAWKKEMNKALDKKEISFTFTEIPLSRILQFFRLKTEINFVADLEEGVDPRVTFFAYQLRLRKALNWIAKLSGTKWELKDEAVYFGKDIEGVEPVPTKKGHGADWEKEINKILDKKEISFTFTEEPLSQALRLLEDLTDIDFVADLEEGVDPRITLDANQLALRKALKWIAIVSKTKWELKDGTIYFSNKDIEDIEPAEDKKPR